MAPFFPGGGRGGGGGLESTRQWAGVGGVTGGGSCEEFGVDKGGGVIVHNQGVRGRGVHGLVMMVQKSLMSDV